MSIQLSALRLISAGLAIGFFARTAVAVSAGISPDFIVAADGSSPYRTIQSALDSIPHDNHERRILFIKNGTYNEKIRVDANDVTLQGESRSGVHIEFPQGATEFRAKPDRIGIAVLNINGDDCVVTNLTIQNTQGVVGVHAFAVYGRGDRTVIEDCDILSEGNDTLSLWRANDRQFDDGARTHSSPNGRYYHARLRVRGSVDFICPRGWCYMRDSEIFEVNPRAEAAIWHDGSRDQAMKFVLRNCRFDGMEGWQLARHHHDAQLFLLDCQFAHTMRDRAPHRVVYPLDGQPATEADRKRNAELDATNRWGERIYYWNCHRAGGDYAWHRDNLAAASGTPTPEQVTAAWTFGGTWDPESIQGPHIIKIEETETGFVVIFSESVTVKGTIDLLLSNGDRAAYGSGSGTERLVFPAKTRPGTQVKGINVDHGTVLATEASAALRTADFHCP